MKVQTYKPKRGKRHLVCGYHLKWVYCTTAEMGGARGDFVDAAEINCNLCLCYLKGFPPLIGRRLGFDECRTDDDWLVLRDLVLESCSARELRLFQVGLHLLRGIPAL